MESDCIASASASQTITPLASTAMLTLSAHLSRYRAATHCNLYNPRFCLA
jgi:hypothetical protein